MVTKAAATAQKPRQIRVPDETWEWLKRQAAAEDRSVNWYVNRLLEREKKRQAAKGT